MWVNNCLKVIFVDQVSMFWVMWVLGGRRSRTIAFLWLVLACAIPIIIRRTSWCLRLVHCWHWSLASKFIDMSKDTLLLSSQSVYQARYCRWLCLVIWWQPALDSLPHDVTIAQTWAIFDLVWSLVCFHIRFVLNRNSMPAVPCEPLKNKLKLPSK